MNCVRKAIASNEMIIIVHLLQDNLCQKKNSKKSDGHLCRFSEFLHTIMELLLDYVDEMHHAKKSTCFKYQSCDCIRT